LRRQAIHALLAGTVMVLGSMYGLATGVRRDPIVLTFLLGGIVMLMLSAHALFRLRRESFLQRFDAIAETSVEEYTRLALLHAKQLALAFGLAFVLEVMVLVILDLAGAWPPSEWQGLVAGIVGTTALMLVVFAVLSLRLRMVA